MPVIVALAVLVKFCKPHQRVARSDVKTSELRCHGRENQAGHHDEVGCPPLADSR
jgi:hypothetical protein